MLFLLIASLCSSLFFCQTILILSMDLWPQKLLETLHSARPNMTLIASDFSLLPDVRLAGEGAPLVSSKVSFNVVFASESFSKLRT